MRAVPASRRVRWSRLRGRRGEWTGSMSTYVLKAKDVHESWQVVDAAGRPLGRLASEVAAILRGKHRPTFTPSMGNGDFVIVINAAKVTISGDQREKKYYRHSQYPGGLRSISQDKLLATRP